MIAMIPLNPLLIVYLAIYLVSVAMDMIIDEANRAYLKECGDKVPQAFKGAIDEKELQKINRYTCDNTHFTLIQKGTSNILFLFVILSGVLPWLSNVLSGVNFILAGLIFFGVPGLVMAIMGIPFDYYHSFVIEERYGFNTKTVKTWFSDLIKTLLLSVVLGSILLSSLLVMVRYTGELWWIWAWAIYIGFQLILTILHPTVIAPFFNKFTPLEDQELAVKIKELAEREGLSLRGIYQMDATKRSRHTNAYFSGLGKTKRIVLFDSLIQSHDMEEIMAVMSHEIGHLKKNHIKKEFAIVCVISAALFYLASKMITWEAMFQGFGFSVMPLYVGLFLVGVLWEPAVFFLAPFWMAISRKFELEADHYAARIMDGGKPLITVLKKMAKDNLSNLRPHPVYVCFNYSHPPLLERIRRLESNDMPQFRRQVVQGQVGEKMRDVQCDP